MSQRAFRFGVVAGAETGAEWLRLAQEIEDQGYDVLLSSDHLDLSGSHIARFSPLVGLAAASAVTSTIKLGTSVLNQGLRHPAVLARELTSLDALSGGRVEIGIGAGWAEYEHQWAGIPFDPAPVRIRRLREYVAVLRGLLGTTPFSFEGEFFTIEDMPGDPRLTTPPPLLVGGSGRRMLALAADVADIVSINILGSTEGRAEDLDERVSWVRDALGARRDEVELNSMIAGAIVTAGSRAGALNAALADPATSISALASAFSPDALLNSPGVLVGSPAGIAEELLSRRDRWGISYWIISGSDARAFAPVVSLLKGT